MFYKLHNSEKNGNVILPVTNQDILDYCMSNPELANAICEKVNDVNFLKWMEDVYNELASLRKISYDDAKNLVKDIDGEAEALYQSGMTIVAEAANELDIMLNFLGCK